jgi:hypothetical protein
MTDRKILIENIINYWCENNDLTERESNEIVSLRKDLKVINYTRCSTQLKEKKPLTFEEWKSFLYKNSEITYLIGDKEYFNHELPIVYKEFVN